MRLNIFSCIKLSSFVNFLIISFAHFSNGLLFFSSLIKNKLKKIIDPCHLKMSSSNVCVFFYFIFLRESFPHFEDFHCSATELFFHFWFILPVVYERNLSLC